jgi:hypothetical protein
MKFRKKPVEVDAEQFLFNETLPMGACDKQHDGIKAGVHVHTLEGTSYDLQDGDWVICGIKGEYYPCKPDIFDQTYDSI